MIHRLHLTNFQSHADTTLDFHPGVNVIIGPSDSGKTAVVRALRWIIENQPGGDGYRRHDTKETEATLTVTGVLGPLTVTRTRKGKKLNAYYLSTSPDPYKALGRGGVPDDIAAVLNLGPLNLEHQHDAPFLLASNPGEVGRILNAVVNLEEIDDAIRRANSRVQAHKLDATERGNDLLQLEADLEALAYVDDMDADVVGLETDDKECRDTTGREEGLYYLLDELVSREADVADWALLASAGPEVTQLEQIQDLRADTVERTQTISLLASDLTYAQNQVAHWERARAMGPEVEALDSLYLQHERVSDRATAFGIQLFNWGQAEEEAATRATALVAARAALTAAVPETCPTCGQPWPEEDN